MTAYCVLSAIFTPLDKVEAFKFYWFNCLLDFHRALLQARCGSPFCRGLYPTLQELMAAIKLGLFHDTTWHHYC